MDTIVKDVDGAKIEVLPVEKSSSVLSAEVIILEKREPNSPLDTSEYIEGERVFTGRAKSIKVSTEEGVKVATDAHGAFLYKIRDTYKPHREEEKIIVEKVELHRGSIDTIEFVISTI